MESAKRTKQQDNAVEDFFNTSFPPKDLPQVQSQLDDFLLHNKNKFIVLLTSGGTTVPLERNTVRFIDNFSTGARGAHMAQEFLSSKDVSLVFLHRVGSVMPFTFNVASSHVDFALLQQLGGSHNDKEKIQNDAKLCKHMLDTKRLLAIPFVSVTEYLFKLRACSVTLNANNSKLMVVLAAAVSDFFVRDRDMDEHKIQSTEVKALDLHLEPVPKMLGALKRDWASNAFCVSFKLETDEAILIDKARGAIAKYAVDLVVANELHSRYNKVILVENELTTVNKPQDQLIEVPLVSALLTKAGFK